jgi:hypothetical protein
MAFGILGGATFNRVRSEEIVNLAGKKSCLYRSNPWALGFCCGKHKAGTLMKLADIPAKQRKKLKATTDSKQTFPVARIS